MGLGSCRKKDLEQNIVYVAHADTLEQSAKDRYRVEKLHWIAGPPSTRELQVRIRHGRALFDADVELTEDGARVHLDRGEPGVAPGQFTVFYDGDVCLGGATIVG